MVRVNKYFIPYIVILIFIGIREKIAISFLVVFLHEIVHYITARFLGFGGFDLEILPVGAVLKLKDIDEASPKEDIIIAASAPLFNIIFGILFYKLYHIYNVEIYHVLFQCNMIIGVFNLVPAYPLDGGRILRDIIRCKTIFKVANNITIYISISIGIIFIFYYLFLFFAGVTNINFGLIALLIIVSSLKERERVVYLIMGDIIKKRYKFIKRGYMENKSISVHYKKSLINILSIVEKNKYNVFLVLDDEMKVMDVIYEEEVVEALKIYGNITLEELMRIQDKIEI
ncbi:M50 family metallopeptidase [Clostridium rectalis]|uniref:M50 family metallopeptidase n=1 Tax=Clostridium rectalis TaxID=2040295 RepID=UPI000F641C41|nr:M50 family metallopeptidase [Clostridium rectalis]